MDAVATAPHVAGDETSSAVQRAVPAAREWWRQALVLAVLLVVTAVACLLFWPGLMDMDTAAEYWAARDNTYDDWHTAVLSGVWHLGYAAGLHNPGWALVPTVLVFLVGLYLVLRIRLSRPWAVAGGVACFAFPPVLAWGVHLGKDTWLAAFALCGVGLVARAGRTQGRARAVSLTVAVLCALLAAATRQNGIVITLAIALAICLLMLSPRWQGWRRIFVNGGIAAAASLAALVVLAGVQRWPMHVRAAHPEQTLYLYDVAALSRAEHKVLLPRDVYPSQDLQYLEVWSNRENVNALQFGPTARVPFPLSDTAVESLRSAWFSAVRHYPTAYLRNRLHMTLDQLTITARPDVPYQDPPQPPVIGYSSQFPALQTAAMHYFGLGTSRPGCCVAGGPLQAVWAYLLLDIAALVWLVRRRSVVDTVVALLAAATLVYVATMSFAAPGVILRYVYIAIAVAVPLTVLLGVDVVAALRQRRARSDSPA